VLVMVPPRTYMLAVTGLPCAALMLSVKFPR
jgi:hypothetical protein